MHYFAHYHLLGSDDPYEIYGSFLPDIAKYWGKRVRSHVLLPEMVGEYGSIAWGVNHHIAVDDLFHSHSYFREKQDVLSIYLADGHIARGWWATLVAEYMIELTIDDKLEIDKEALWTQINDADSDLVFRFAYDMWGVKIEQREHEIMDRRISEYKEDGWLVRAMLRYDRFLKGRLGFDRNSLEEAIDYTRSIVDISFVEEIKEELVNMTFHGQPS